jgi:predicted DNA-binding transcriptional regulator AlpA
VTPDPITPLAKAIAVAVLAEIAPFLVANGALKPRLLTVEQAAAYLGRTEKAIYNMKARGAFPVVQGDGRITFDIQDPDQWIQNNKETTT